MSLRLPAPLPRLARRPGTVAVLGGVLLLIVAAVLGATTAAGDGRTGLLVLAVLGAVGVVVGISLVVISRGGISLGGIGIGVTRPRSGGRDTDLDVALTVARDAAARYEADRAVLAGIVDSAHEAVIGCLPDGTITLWNPGAERIFGYPAPEALGLSIRMLYPVEAVDPVDPTDPADPARVPAEIAAGTPVQERATTRLHRDGTPLDVLVTLTPICDPGGSVVGMATLARELAPVKEAEQHRLQVERQLYQLQRTESLEQLAGGIAHDFNNLLAVILSSAEFIGTETDDPVAVRADAEQITMAADRAAQLTRQLLHFARGEHSARPFDLGVLAADLEPILARNAGPGVALRLRSAEVAGIIAGDPGRIEQALINLVLNARDAMPDGGSIVLATEVAGLDAGEPRVRLSVTDTGTGMAPDVAARAFDPFFTTKDIRENSGLGLAGVQTIVKEAGGGVSLRTAPGAGTTVTLDFPFAGERHPIETAVPPPARAATPARVLVVDDQGPVGDIVVRILRRRGYEVQVARSGPEALAIAAQHPIDLLLTDVVMPGMSGRDLAAALTERQPELPVLYMSGYSDTVLERRVADRDVLVLTKPFTERQLLDSTELALHGQDNSAT